MDNPAILEVEANICRIEAKEERRGLNTGVCRYVFTRVFMHAIKITSGQMAQVYTLVCAAMISLEFFYSIRKLGTNPRENRSLPLKLLPPAYEYKGIPLKEILP